MTSLNLYVDDSASVDLFSLAGLPSLVNLSVNGESDGRLAAVIGSLLEERTDDEFLLQLL